ncbi:hypothetical protein V7S76_10280 [Aquirufa sp. ROCK2-A2]
MEKVYFQNYTTQQINLNIDNREIHLAPQFEEWTILPQGPTNIILTSYLGGFKKKRETFQIEIKEGTNYVDILMDEEVQKYSPRPTNLLTIIFLLNVIPSFVNEHKPLIDMRFFVFDTFHLSLSIAVMMAFSQLNSNLKAQRRIQQLSTVFVLDVHSSNLSK